jgi:hypothetical protein
MRVRPAEIVAIRHRRRKVVATTAVAAAVTGSLFGVGSLTAGPSSELATGINATTTLSSATSPTTSVASDDASQIVESAFWAESFTGWVDQVGLDATDVRHWASGSPVGEGGSVVAVVEDHEAQVSVLGEFRGFVEGEYRDDPSWEREVAGSTVEGVATDEGTMFYIETDAGSRRVSLVIPIGVILIQADGGDPSRLPSQESLEAIATRMTAIAYDLVTTTLDDELVATAVFEPAEPSPDQWIQLDTDVWIALVPEDDDFGDTSRLWIKTDTQEPTPAPSTDTRSLVARAGDSDLIVVVFDGPGQARPDVVTAQWSDGSSESGEMVWAEEGGVGIARLEWRDDAELEMIEGP